MTAGLCAFILHRAVGAGREVAREHGYIDQETDFRAYAPIPLPITLGCSTVVAGMIVTLRYSVAAIWEADPGERFAEAQNDYAPLLRLAETLNAPGEMPLIGGLDPISQAYQHLVHIFS